MKFDINLVVWHATSGPHKDKFSIRYLAMVLKISPGHVILFWRLLQNTLSYIELEIYLRWYFNVLLWFWIFNNTSFGYHKGMVQSVMWILHMIYRKNIWYCEKHRWNIFTRMDSKVCELQTQKTLHEINFVQCKLLRTCLRTNKGI